MQDLWRQKIDWGKPIPSSELQQLFIQLVNTTTVEMKRHYFTNSSVNMDHKELHAFVDASMDAYMEL